MNRNPNRIENNSLSFLVLKNIEIELKTILLMLYANNKISKEEISAFWPYTGIADKEGKILLGENGSEIFLRKGGPLHPPILIFGNGLWGFKTFLKFSGRKSENDPVAVVAEYDWKTKKFNLYGDCGAEELAIATHWMTEGEKGAESVQACMALTEMANLEPEKFKQKFSTKKYLEKMEPSKNKSGCIIPIILSVALFISIVTILIVYV